MKKRPIEALDYGRYDIFYGDPRTKKALSEIDGVAKKLDIQYALIGGLAAYLYSKNPPEDFPDIDILVYADLAGTMRVIKALSQRPKFEKGPVTVDGDVVFAMFRYDGYSQVDVFNDLDELMPKPTKRKKGVELEQVENLIIEKLIRPKATDVRMVLDLLAYVDYDKALLGQLARENHMTGMVNGLIYFSKNMAAGRMSKEGINAIVKRLASG